jgi:putative DNA primase/helicase
VPYSPKRTASATLQSMADDLVRRLGGYATPTGAMCRCPAHDDRHPSLSVRLGERALLFKCFAGCDTDDVLRAIRQVDGRALSNLCPGGEALHGTGREAALRNRAREIWDKSLAIPGTAAQSYLAARGLHELSPALRFNRRTPLGSRASVIYRPALIAGLREAGDLVAVHRTFLAHDASKLASDLIDPRRLLGRPRGGAVVLAPAGSTLGLAEGIETAMSASILLDLPVWATLGSERLAHIAVPELVQQLVILPDNDPAGHAAAANAVTAYSHEGRTVEVIWPPAPFNDWNDVLRANGRDRLAMGG